MRVDLQLTGGLTAAGDAAREIAGLGADGAFVFEGPNDAFLPLALAATSTDLDLYTNVAIAPPRSPMHLAQLAWDLQRASGGRFSLGLGTQIQAHVERRFGMPWWPPLTRMRETFQALRAIFAAWQDGTEIDYVGATTRHTLMPPMLRPDPLPVAPPALWGGAVGPRMTRMVAAEADGLVTHPLASRRTLTEHTMPLVDEGLAQAGRTRAGFEVVCNVLCALYEDETDRQAALDTLRAIIGFYGSTPAYRVMLDVHGWGDLQPQLRELTREGRWGELPDLVTDEMVDTFAVFATPDEAAATIQRRFSGVADRVALGVHGGDNGLLTRMIAALRAEVA